MIQLKDLQLIESATFSVDFNQAMTSSGKGEISIDYGEIGVEAGGKLSTDESKCLIMINATPEITGKTVIQNTLVDGFHLKINFRLVYAYDAKLEFTPEILNEGRWFFESQIRSFFKTFSKNILKDSTINEINIPF